MEQFSKYVGLDVHKETIAVSVAEANGGELRYMGEIANTPEAIDKVVKHIGHEYDTVNSKVYSTRRNTVSAICWKMLHQDWFSIAWTFPRFHILVKK